jgi:hypothetical protein
MICICCASVISKQKRGAGKSVLANCTYRQTLRCVMQMSFCGFFESLASAHSPPDGRRAGGLVIDGKFVAGQLVMCGWGRLVAGQLVMAGTAIKFVKCLVAGGESLVGEV